MRSSIFTLFLALGFIALSFSAEAQRFTSRKRYWSVGFSLNATNYLGDIVPRTSRNSLEIAKTKPDFSVFVQRRVLPNISLRGSLSYGFLAGDDYISADGKDYEGQTGVIDDLANNENQFRLYRNQHFRNRIAELSGAVVFDLVQNRGLYFKRPDKPIPYLFAGIAVAFHNPQAQIPQADALDRANGDAPVGRLDADPGTWVNLKDYDETFDNGAPINSMFISIPFGFGIRYKLSNKVDIAFEAGYRYTFIDNLDGVSGNYTNTNITTTELANADRSTRTAYYLANRSALNKSINAAQGRNDREAILATMSSIYRDRAGDPDIGQYAAPGEIKGKTGFGNNDQYIVYGIHLSYIMSNNVKCPKFR